jgi:hypothetical protein
MSYEIWDMGYEMGYELLVEPISHISYPISQFTYLTDTKTFVLAQLMENPLSNSLSETV